MRSIHLDLGSRSYPIYIGSQLLASQELLLKHTKGRCLVISNETLAPLYLEKLATHFSKPPETVILPDGETHKNLHSFEHIMTRLLQLGFDRDTTLIALGGGVIGDLTGFAAACYQRGVNFIQIPTSLLAQVDSSVGGKTGVNHPLGKNMIGAFYQPQCVIIDVDTLSTLPDRELRAGLAEVIKYGLLGDADFVTWLEANLQSLLARDAETLIHAIEVSCLHKARIVAADETEQHQRALLNLGHTFGHAIETYTEYKAWSHGEAVAIGMCMAADFSAQLGWLPASAAERCRQLIHAAGLPTKPPQIPGDTFLQLMRADKKNRGGQIHLILLQDIGKAVLSHAYPEAALLQFLHDYPRLDQTDICS